MDVSFTLTYRHRTKRKEKRKLFDQIPHTFPKKDDFNKKRKKLENKTTLAMCVYARARACVCVKLEIKRKTKIKKKEHNECNGRTFEKKLFALSIKIHLKIILFRSI